MRPLPTAEKALVWILSLHLCFLAWAFGSTRPLAQQISLGLAVIGFVVALWRRPPTPADNPVPGSQAVENSPPHRIDAPSNPAWARLWRFPPFWLGLALLGYIAIQAFNPSFSYRSFRQFRWLVAVDSVSWLPSGIDVPFARFNTWSQFIIDASTWLVICSAWIGLTRRRSLVALVLVLVVNAVALAAIGFIERLTHADKILWLWIPPDATPFSTFVYKNHAGAYLALMTFVAAGLALWIMDRGERKLQKSTPAPLLALAAVFVGASVFFSLSRGATLTLTATAIAFVVWLFHRRRRTKATGTSWRATLVVAAVLGAFVLNTARYLDYDRVAEGFDRLHQEGWSEVSLRGRLLLHAAAFDMLRDHGLRGVGAGGFRHLFSAYTRKYPEIYADGQIYWNHAHDDWLEIPIDLGLTGSLLLLAVAIWYSVHFIRQRVWWHPIAFPIVLSCTQTLVHAWYDFPFQCPAILIAWCTLLTIAARWVMIQESGPRSLSFKMDHVAP
ncbi:MAG TPA: O-antigen ligase family protein [Opitutaceae bacterium]|nr:O-antigen ligase family protein [Opitutaceae bacterium]